MSWLREQEEVEEMEEKEIDEIESDETAEELVENDEISPGEAGFVEGYADLKEAKVCKNCGKELDLEKAVTKKIGEKEILFCSQECADSYNQKEKKEE